MTISHASPDKASFARAVGGSQVPDTQRSLEPRRMSTTVHHALINCQLKRPSLFATIAQSIVRTLQLWRSRVRERRGFTVIDERDLRDFGISRWEVERELA